METWRTLLEKAYSEMDLEYRTFLAQNKEYFPDQENYFNAFKTLPKEKVRYILFGQDPYPRVQSAGGYAFIDTHVKTLFSSTGLSKEVNRATSLRNFIKMALVASEELDKDDTSQEALARIDRSQKIDTIDALRINFEKNGVLLLNTALVFTDKKSSSRHIKAWRPFMQKLLEGLEQQEPKLILFGTHAKALQKQLPLEKFESIELEHPYNHAFISNPEAHKLFGPMKLLEK